MATQFINYTAQNIGTTTYHLIDGTATTSDPTGDGLSRFDGKAQIMIGCMVANIKTTSVEATVSVRNGSTVTRLVKSVTIPSRRFS